MIDVCEAIPCPVHDGPPPIWEVRRYPDGEVLHVADDYWAADRWRVQNDLGTVIVPHWRPL